LNSATTACDINTNTNTNTNTLPDTSSHLQGPHEFNGFYRMSDSVSDVNNLGTDFVATDTSGSIAEDMLNDMANVPFYSTLTDTFEEDFMAAQASSSMDGNMLNDVTRNLFGYTATQIPDYSATNKYGYTPMNTPSTMPINTFGLAALPKLDLTNLNLLADTATEAFNSRGCSMSNTTLYPFKQEAMDAADSPTLGAYHAGTSDSFDQNTSDWYLESEMPPLLYHRSKCGGLFLLSPTDVESSRLRRNGYCEWRTVGAFSRRFV
jgi:hypothetical protein